jgi:hypothetical protein
MKLRHYILILISGILISCSKDDTKPEMGWFPVKITKTAYLQPVSSSKIIHLEYNNKNQISKIEIDKSDSDFIDEYLLTYSSTNVPETLRFSNDNPANNGDVSLYTFNYTEGILSSWINKTIKTNGDEQQGTNRIINYNHPTYSFLGNEIDIDITKNISRMQGFLRNNSLDSNPEFFIHRLPKAGVFENVEPLATLQLFFTIFIYLEMDFYAFSTHEISHLQLPTQKIDFQTTRNQDGLITSVITANGNTMYARYDYEYEQRKKP